ncbi:MAG: carboxylating nicotinate-nucleotide diphosphorylase [Clostridia bacterium]|nr:carboxylating nicotinate-nucleotide diphosphorylase [Clostridia bacterium]
MELNKWELEDLIKKAFAEDVKTGDVTTNSIIPAEAVTTGYIYAKESGVVAGLPVAETVFKMLNLGITFIPFKQDGDKIEAEETLAQVSGEARAVLTGERVALNLLQRLSGIATRTARIVELLTYYNTKVVDTRKTTPGLRFLEKYAVRMGGGHNHRFGLYDAVLIKDNHIKVAGGIMKAVAMARQKAPHTMKIEVEVENLEGVREALEARAEIIMLDNMDLETMAKAVEMVNGEALLEASGGIQEDQVVEIAKLGIDLISIGALTHSVKALDISLDVGEIKTR